MRYSRQNKIIEIINNNEVDTQEKLAALLKEQGFEVTQATISRDIKDLHLIKVIGESGKYKYAQPDRNRSAVNVRLTRILSDSLVSVEQAGYMIVVKTLSGSAGVAAEAIDTMQWSGILGTIAGDNTIFIVARDERVADDITARLRKLSSDE